MAAPQKNILLFNFFSLGIVQAISSLLQIAVVPYVIKMIGIDGYGVVSVAQVVMFFLIVFTDYGSGQVATREIALHRSDTEKVSAIFFKVLFSRLLLCIVAFFVLLAIVLIIPFFRIHLFLYLTGFAFVAGQSLLLTWFFQGINKMHFIAIATLVARIIFAILVFIFIKNKADDFYFLFFLGIGNVAAGLVSIFFVLKKFKLIYIKPLRGDIVQELKDGWRITVSNLSISTCQYLNIVILRIFTNDLVAGYYGIAEKIFFTIRQVLGIFSQAIYPEVCRIMLEGPAKVISFFKKLYIPFLVAVILGCTVAFIIAPQILYFFLKADYGAAVILLRVLLITSVIVCLDIPAALGLLAMHQDKRYFQVYTLATVLNIVLNIILVHYFNATGTVLAILATELFILVGLVTGVYRYSLFKKREVLL
jgi:PST family polysaccharide transporter